MKKFVAALAVILALSWSGAVFAQDSAVPADTEVIASSVSSEVPPVTESNPEVPPVTEGAPEVPPVTEGDPEVPPVTESNPEVPPVTEGDPEVPPVTEGDPEVPPVTEGDPEVPPVTEGDPEVPPVTEGDPEVPPVTEGDSEVPPVTEGDPEVPPVTEGDPEVPPVTEGDPEVPPVTEGDPEVPPATEGDPEAPPAEKDEIDAGVTGPADSLAQYFDQIVVENGKIYYYDSNGEKVINAILCIQGYWYRFTEDGSAYIGWYGNHDFYYDTQGRLCNTGFTVIDGATYYFYTDGTCAKNASLQIGGYWYRFMEDGRMVTGWYGDHDYYYDAQGHLYNNGLMEVDGKLYYFYPYGSCAKNETMQIGNYWYRFTSDGSAYTGWYGDYDYYYDAQGRLYNNGLATVDGGIYYFYAYGSCAKNTVMQIGDYWYRFTEDGSAHTGWYGNKDFYYDEQGHLFNKGLAVIEGKTYYFYPDGSYAKNISVQIGDYWYRFTEDGSAHTGWYGNKDYYYDEQGHLFNKGIAVIEGKTYYFYSHGGYAKDTVMQIDGYWYRFTSDGSAFTGWYGNKDYYYDEQGHLFNKGLAVIEGKTYYFYSHGGYAKDTVMQIDGYWYRFTSDGSAFTGWYGEKLFYYGPDGRLYNQGMMQVDGTTYYFNADGSYATQSLKKIGTKTYYFDANGAMVVNQILQIGNYWYRFTADGSAYTGWYGNRDFYYDSEGRLYNKGFATIDGSVYYFYPDGSKAVGTVTINGETYIFDANGVLQNSLNGKLGIDVSEHQGYIDWNAVKASGVNFAIIRVLKWDKAQNYYAIDARFHENIQGALNAGIQVGMYLYSYAFSNEEIMEEINFVLPTLNQYKDKLTYPVYIDYEDNLLLQNTSSNEQRTDILRTGMDALQQQGYLAGFYTYYNFAQNYINTQQLLDEGYDFWVAHTSAQSNPWEGASVWQNSHTGSVNGISGNVDMNISYVDYASLNRTVTVYDINTGKNVSGTLRDIVAQIVQNEVGNGLGLTGMDKNKLYQAQAVAARSWLEFQWQHYGSSYIPKVGLQTPTAAVRGATNQVVRFTVRYNNKVANAAYGSCAGSYTNSAANMGWGDYSYLTPVESKYDSQFVPQYYPKVNTIGTDTMRNNIIKMVGQDQFNKYANDMSKWITQINKDAYGNITSAVVCGVTVSGGKFYENCWGLYGANLNGWQYNGNGTWTFSSNGNGHGVGMSQYGAAGYIANGMSWRQVLLHYYTGTTISSLA